jgi:hypothetical protein
VFLAGNKDYATVYVTFTDEVALFTRLAAFYILLLAAHVTDPLRHRTLPELNSLDFPERTHMGPAQRRNFQMR